MGVQTFGREEAAMLYFPTIDAHRRAQALLQNRGIEVLEGDFRLHDRYLMERFAKGGLYFEGLARYLGSAIFGVRVKFCRKMAPLI